VATFFDKGRSKEKVGRRNFTFLRPPKPSPTLGVESAFSALFLFAQHAVPIMRSPQLSYSRRFSLGFALLMTVFVTSVSARTSIATEPERKLTAADLLPDSVVAYADAPDLSGLVETVLNHSVTQQIKQSPIGQQAMQAPQFAFLESIVKGFEGQVEMSWQEALKSFTSGGVSIALDAPTQGVAVLIKGRDAEEMKKFSTLALGTIQLANNSLGKSKKAEYRGYDAYAITDKAKMAIMDQWLLITNNGDLGRSIIDNYADKTFDQSLAKNNRYQAALKQVQESSLRGYVDIEAIRALNVAPEIYRGTTDNIVAEFLFGGLVGNLKHTPYAAVGFQLSNEAIRLQAASAFDPENIEPRQYFFGDDGKATAPAVVSLPNTLQRGSLYRDMSQMWLLSPDLMTDKANEELAQADTTLTTLFSGRDFGEDILGALKPGISWIVVSQSFSDKNPLPAIKLPAFAIEVQMIDAETTTREFKRVFQSFIGFLNIVSAMNGQPQLDLDFLKEDDVSGVIASFVPPMDKQDWKKAPIQYNFSPSLAFTGNRMVLASTTELATAMCKAKPQQPNLVQQGDNGLMHFEVAPIRSVLEQNRQQLVAQNMLEKGHGMEAAEAEIGILFKILSMFQEATVQLRTDDDHLQLSTEVRFASSN
jgi:hypothetical protein